MILFFFSFIHTFIYLSVHEYNINLQTYFKKQKNKIFFDNILNFKMLNLMNLMNLMNFLNIIFTLIFANDEN
jgi:hypothetical protein